MKKLMKPWSLIPSTIIPDIIIGVIMLYTYSLVATEIGDTVGMWILFGVVYCVSTLSAVLVVTKYRGTDKDIGIQYGIARLCLCCIMILVLMYSFNELRFDITRLFVDISLYSGIFVLLAPSVLHSMYIILEAYSVRKGVKANNKKLFLFLLPPVVIYILFTADMVVEIRAMLVLVALCFGFFVVGIFRNGATDKLDKYQEFVGLAILLGSIGGLALNQSLGNIFGDFSDYRFYLMDIVVCITLMIPNRSLGKWRLYVFCIKCFTYVFSLYFFIVFVPYLPLSVIGILVMGLGLLMLFPTLLIIVHTRNLIKEFIELKKTMDYKKLVGITLACMLIIPIYSSIILIKDRGVMSKAVDYIYKREYSIKAIDDVGNIKAIERSLKNMRKMNYGDELRNDDFFDTQHTVPIITSLYNKVVLNGYTITNDRIEYLEAIYLGEVTGDAEDKKIIEYDKSKEFEIKSIKTNTEYIIDGDYYETWMDIEIRNKGYGNNEFRTVIGLDNTVFISDYYLDVFGIRKKGLIADKRAANWIYNRVRRRSLDPGLLTYISDNEVSFKVFPFDAGQVRSTGIKFMHKEPTTISFGNQQIKLGEPENGTVSKPISLNSGGVVVPGSYKNGLKSTTRQREYYFLIDGSKGSNTQELVDAVDNYITENKLSREEIRLKVIQGYKQYDPGDKSFRSRGGYYVDYAIKSIFYENYIAGLNKRPIIVLATNDIDGAIIRDDIDYFNNISPEGLEVNVLDGSKNLQVYDLGDRSLKKGSLKDKRVYVYDIASEKRYLSMDDRDEYILNTFNGMRDEDSAYNTGLALGISKINTKLHPKDINENSLELVKDSIENNIMTDLTSFIVLETKAQERAMMKKQKELLNSDYIDNINKDYEVMDEPSILTLIVMLLIIIFTVRHLNGRHERA